MATLALVNQSKKLHGVWRACRNGRLTVAQIAERTGVSGTHAYVLAAMLVKSGHLKPAGSVCGAKFRESLTYAAGPEPEILQWTTPVSLQGEVTDIGEGLTPRRRGPGRKTLNGKQSEGRQTDEDAERNARAEVRRQAQAEMAAARERFSAWPKWLVRVAMVGDATENEMEEA